ncbi:hypothetical protein PMKS-002720 [Pichia membranifaciens]|uniref:Phosphoinositide phospholipase C n=1 Tax=Pichia membranifaciens TaxID=4926 RepID=A0A1Q2YI60_9ASCO|nr:hypothetical protein PMKS-002720 [Pichia membranifaciens]
MNTSRRNTATSNSGLPQKEQLVPPPSAHEETADLTNEPESPEMEEASLKPIDPFDPSDPDSFPPDLLFPGIDMIRVTRRKRIRRAFKLTLPSLTLTWNSKIKSKVEMDKIQSIRVGEDARNYREEFNVSKEFNDLWITVIYVSSHSSHSSALLCNDLKALHMIATTKRNYDIMLKTLKLLSQWSKEQESLVSCADVHEFSKIKWDNKTRKLDRQLLSFEDVLKLTSELHVYMDVSYLRLYFDQCDTNKKKFLDFPQFQTFVSKLKNRPEFGAIFQELNIQNGRMLLSDFKKFVREIQNESSHSDTLVDDIFVKFSHSKSLDSYMTPSNLSYYLNSSYATPLFNEESLDPHYYSHPLTDYFISSSHNTYLLGKQFHGFSSIEGYIHALQRGCRCIEIDVWDGTSSGSKEQHPIVTHGHTLTNSIEFKLVVDIIRKYAFITTPYPLIISLEIRCSQESQLKCVAIMKTIFGDMLVLHPKTNESFMPSPRELKHKILVKVKKSKSTTIIEPQGSPHSLHSSFSTSSTQSDDINPNYTENNYDEEEVTHRESSNSLKKMVSKPAARTIIVPELTSLAPYFVGIKFRNFSLPESKTYNHVFSFSDRSLLLLLRDKMKLVSVLKHNRRGMMRVYPSVVRFRSDNFNPITFWELGCQMAATNWQIWDCGEELSESLFASIGSEVASGLGYSGYRLKPKNMRNPETSTTMYDKEKLKVQTLSSLVFDKERFFDISILSGQQLPKPKEFGNIGSNGYTPWVEIEVYNVLPVHAEIVHLHRYDRASTLDEEKDDIEDEKDQEGEEDEDEKEESVKENEYTTSNEKQQAVENALDGKMNMKLVKAGSVKLSYVEAMSANPNYSVLFKTRFAENPGDAFSPKWNASCRLKYLTNENELAFIRVTVKTLRANKTKTGVIGKVGNAVVKNNNHDYTIGSWCCKIGDLKQGYRHIRLGDNKGEELIYSSLFIKIKTR